VKGLEKNFFAGYDYSPGSALVSQASLLAIHVWPWLAVWRARGWSRRLWVPTIAANVTLFLAARARLGVRPTLIELSYAVATPATALLVTYAAMRSMLITLRQGGIRWRDTFYPLSELRANQGLARARP
jgi:hypothetical protein